MTSSVVVRARVDLLVLTGQQIAAVIVGKSGRRSVFSVAWMDRLGLVSRLDHSRASKSASRVLERLESMRSTS